MPRPARIAPKGCVYHILTRGNNRQDVFKSEVELNPARAKIVEDPKDYRWSSYNVYAYSRGDRITDEHPIYTSLSDKEIERRKRYRDFVRGMIKEKKAMKGEMDRRVVYGSEKFIEKASKEYKVKAVIKLQGSPGKDENEDKYNRPLLSLFLLSPRLLLKKKEVKSQRDLEGWLLMQWLLVYL